MILGPHNPAPFGTGGEGNQKNSEEEGKAMDKIPEISRSSWNLRDLVILISHLNGHNSFVLFEILIVLP